MMGHEFDSSLEIIWHLEKKVFSLTNNCNQGSLVALKRSPLFSTGSTESMSVSRTSFVVAQFCTLKKITFQLWCQWSEMFSFLSSSAHLTSSTGWIKVQCFEGVDFETPTEKNGLKKYKMFFCLFSGFKTKKVTIEVLEYSFVLFRFCQRVLLVISFNFFSNDQPLQKVSCFRVICSVSADTNADPVVTLMPFCFQSRTKKKGKLKLPSA